MSEVPSEEEGTVYLLLLSLLVKVVKVPCHPHFDVNRLVYLCNLKALEELLKPNRCLVLCSVHYLVLHGPPAVHLPLGLDLGSSIIRPVQELSDPKIGLSMLPPILHLGGCSMDPDVHLHVLDHEGQFL